MSVRKIFILALLGVFVLENAAAQTFNSKASFWKNRRQTYFFGAGVSNFLGELGGRDQIGTDFIYDLEFSQTRPTLHAGYRYQVGDRVYLKGQFTFGFLAGNDALTEEIFRKNRNLHFRSTFYELSLLTDVDVIRFGHKTRYNRVQAGPRHTSAIYLSTGLGISRFNPKGNFDGNWYALKPRGTEGQGQIDGPEEYKLISLVIPFGMGYRWDINEEWTIGAEIMHRLTFTDYIDDVSTVYFDNDIIRQNKGELAAYFADPSLGYYLTDNGDRVPLNSTGTGQQRGDSADNDAYFTFLFTGYYKLPYKRGFSRGKGRVVKRKKRRAVF